MRYLCSEKYGMLMKIAFLISTNKDARHLRDLINSLPDNADYYVHVDSKRDLLHFENMVRRQNVTFIRNRIDVVPGSISEVNVQVELLRKALDADNYDYLVYLCGSDYPLWSNERINSFFVNARGKQILSGIAMVGQGKAAYPYCDFRLLAGHSWRNNSLKAKARVALRNALNLANIHKTLRIHCPLKTYMLYKGVASWAITLELGYQIVSEWDENAQLKEYFSTSYRPVETFVPTVALNSEFAPQCTIVKGRYKGINVLSQLTYIDGAPEPKVLTEVDFNAIKNEDKMFCRKVTTDYSDGLKSMIDADKDGKKLNK